MSPPVHAIDYMALIEAALISMILSGVLWNVLAGYDVVATGWLFAKMLLTASVLTGALVVKELNDATRTRAYR
ncbi:MAG: hypothetical protein ABEH65_11290 [Halobacteriales archaeon]